MYFKSSINGPFTYREKALNKASTPIQVEVDIEHLIQFDPRLYTFLKVGY